jgi:hypothetical protein
MTTEITIKDLEIKKEEGILFGQLKKINIINANKDIEIFKFTT